MTAPLLLVTGFGPFESVDDNPSGALARVLDREDGLRGVVLPVTFRGSAEVLDAVLADLAPRRPGALLSLGVHPGASFRLERRAGATLSSERPDNAGETGEGLALGSGDLFTTLELEPLAAALRAGGWEGEVELSEDAGGYVCERVYRHVLARGAELGVPGLFLHVPPVELASVEAQLGPVRALVGALRGTLGATG